MRKAICLLLTQTDAVAVTRTQAYGVGIGRIYFDEVKCVGNESRLTECRHNPIHNCGHSEDAAVLCKRTCSNYNANYVL